MSSYIQLFQDFVQKTDVGRVTLIPEEDVEQTTSVGESSGNNKLNVGGNNNNNNNNNKMEHSYTRDSVATSVRSANESNNNGLAPARTIILRRTQQGFSCQTHPLDEYEMDDGNQAQIPSYNEISAKESMNECARIAKYVKNTNPDDQEWESRINQYGWSSMQKTLFTQVVSLLDNDQLGRLANNGRANEAMQRRVLVDKSASRMRKVLASVAWDSRLTQWLHCLLMDSLPSTYMASYLDILQTLKTKVPTLLDKMLFGRPMNVSQELLAPVMKKQWEPTAITSNPYTLPKDAVLLVIPPITTNGSPLPARLQKWYQQLANITQIVQVTLPSIHFAQQALVQIAEQIVSLTRCKIQELRHENSTRNIVLCGFNAGAALALQVAMSENISSVVCMGFAYNTLSGVRGTPDDRILDIKVPILFVIGQNSARSSPEEIESLREKMQSESSLVIVGSADDELRVPKSKRKIENVTQDMIDTMVVDEIYEFIRKILDNPPGPRIPTAYGSVVYSKQGKGTISSGGTNQTIVQSSDSPTVGVVGTTSGKMTIVRKRKQDAGGTPDDHTPAKNRFVTHIGRPRTRPLPMGKTIGKQKLSPTNEELSMSIQSILSDGEQSEHSNPTMQTINMGGPKVMTNYEIVAQTKTSPHKTTTTTTLLNPLQKQTIITNAGNSTISIGSTTPTAIGTKIKMIPSNQFVQLKPPMQSQSKIYTIKTTSMLNTATTTTTGGQVGGGDVSAAAGGIGTIVTTTPRTGVSANMGQQQIFTLKSPNGQMTQFVTAAPAAAQQKYTVVKNANGGTTLQLTKAKSVVTAGRSQLDLSNIRDMPIIFADSDGNLTDAINSPGRSGERPNTNTTTLKSSTQKSGVGQLIISQKIIKEAGPATTSTTTSSMGISKTTTPGTYTISNKPGVVGGATILTTGPTSSGGTLTKGNNKVIFINRNTMKPCTTNIIGRSNIIAAGQTLTKYTNVVVTNPKTSATTMVPRAVPSGVQQLLTGTTPNSPIVSSVKQLNFQPLKTGTVTAGGATIKSPLLSQIQVLNSVGTTGTAVTLTSTSPSGQPQFRNIVLKPCGVKQMSPQLNTTQLINRNVTVRKLVNIVPVTKSAAILGVTSSTAVSAAVTGGGGGDASMSPSGIGIQTSPKIITLNPINSSTTTTSAGGNTPGSSSSTGSATADTT